MTWGVKLYFALWGLGMVWGFVTAGMTGAFTTFVIFGIGAFLYDCLQGFVRGVLRLFDGQPHVEYHIYVPAPEKHPDPTAPDDVRDRTGFDDIEMVEVNGKWRKR